MVTVKLSVYFSKVANPVAGKAGTYLSVVFFPRGSSQLPIFTLSKYRVRINYRRILQNHIFTNTEHKYMKLLPFEREMFAVL